jgi:competence protein ComEC
MFVEWNQPFRFFVVLVCGWIAGILLARQGWFPFAFFVGLAISTVLVGSWTIYYWMRGRRIALFLCAVGVAGAILCWYEQHHHSQWPRSFENQRLWLSGQIVSAPEVDGDQLSFVGEITAIRSGESWQTCHPERLQLSVRLRTRSEWQQAQQVKRQQLFSAPVQLQLPLPATNPGGFSYARYLQHRQIDWLGKIESWSQLQRSTQSTWDVRVLIDDWRKQVADRIKRLFPAPTAGLVQSMLIGEREKVASELAELYTLSGIVHLLSISGLHVTMLVGGCYWLCTRLRMTRETTALLLMLLLPVYVLFAGAEPPTVRAGLMSGLSLLAIYFGQRRELLSFLALALWLQLCWNPYQLWEPGFLLSYLITLVLIEAGPRLSSNPSSVGNRIKQMIQLSVLAELAALPIVITFFHQSSLFAWLGDVLFVPLLTLLLFPASLFVLLFSLLWMNGARWLASWIAFFLDSLHQLLLYLKPLFLWQASWAEPSLLWTVLYGVTLILVFLLWNSRHVRYTIKHRLLAIGALALLLYYAHVPAAIKEQETRLTFLDVGQGDSIVLETADGRVMVIDGGGQPSFARERWQQRQQPYDVGRRVVDYLRYRGIQRIDDLVLTHGDYDHLGGLQTVTKQLPVQRVIRNNQAPHSVAEQQLVALWRQRQIPIYQVDRWAQEEWEPGIVVRFYNPAHLYQQTKRNENDASLCIELLIHGQRLLLTGDIEAGGEAAMQKLLPSQPVMLLKVAHHGSRTSSTPDWLDHIQPQHAVISVGRQNRFGHPAPEVVTRLRQRGIHIWRTDQQGAITFRFTPQHFFIETAVRKIDH